MEKQNNNIKEHNSPCIPTEVWNSGETPVIGIPKQNPTFLVLITYNLCCAIIFRVVINVSGLDLTANGGSANSATSKNTATWMQGITEGWKDSRPAITSPIRNADLARYILATCSLFLQMSNETMYGNQVNQLISRTCVARRIIQDKNQFLPLREFWMAKIILLSGLEVGDFNPWDPRLAGLIIVPGMAAVEVRSATVLTARTTAVSCAIRIGFKTSYTGRDPSASTWAKICMGTVKVCGLRATEPRWAPTTSLYANLEILPRCDGGRIRGRSNS